MEGHRGRAGGSPLEHCEDAAPGDKELVRRFYEEVWSRGNFDVADEVFAEDYLRHDQRPSAAAPGPEGQKRIACRRATFSGVNSFRFEHGKVVELWNHRDDLGLIEQLGAPIYARAKPEA